MGKASRTKAELRHGLREPTPREAWRQALKVDRRGRRVGSSLADYERICESGRDRLAEALTARHTLRMDRIASLPDYYRFSAMSGLTPIFWLDKLLRRYGARPSRHPSAYGDKWADNLAWGVDSVVASTRLLLCGQVPGAAAVARNQLERWTLNRAHGAGLVQSSGESSVNFIARVWSSDDLFTQAWFDTDASTEVKFLEDDEDVPACEPTIDHSHVRRADGSEICPAVLYGFLSEIMHGRQLSEALAWDAEELLRSDVLPSQIYVALGAVTDSLVLSLRQIRLGAAFLAHQRQDAGALELLTSKLDAFTDAEAVPVGTDLGTVSTTTPSDQPPRGRLVSPPIAALAPLVPGGGLNPRFLEPVAEMAADYEETLRGGRPANRLFRDDELTTLAFAAHRARSAQEASQALEGERVLYGEEFDLESLDGRATRWVLLTEAASMLGLWHQRQQVRDAACVIGSGLRSAYWLWLEDDSRSMSVLRCVLEQTARVRTWRLKPEKAQALESRQQTTPRDWLEAAGWKRLITLNRALGEFAHMRPGSRWIGAHELLAKLQIDVPAETALFTARGASLDFVSDLVAREISASVAGLSPVVGARLTELLDSVGLETSEGTGSVESRFNHIWRLRTESLGESDVRRAERASSA